MVLINSFSAEIANWKCEKSYFSLHQHLALCANTDSLFLLNRVFGSHSVVNGKEYRIFGSHILQY